MTCEFEIKENVTSYDLYKIRKDGSDFIMASVFFDEIFNDGTWFTKEQAYNFIQMIINEVKE